MRNPFASLFERKSAIASSHELAQYLLSGQESGSGTRVSESTALNLAAVMTCVSLRQRAFASLPVRVYERLDERNRAQATHPAAEVLFQPNSWQTRSEFFGVMETHRVLRGNCYAWKNILPVARLNGRIVRDVVTELVPMHPDRVELVDDGDDLAPTARYRLHRASRPPLDVPASEVLHVKGLSTDGRKGRSVLQDAREMLGVALATQDHAASFWSRDATPSVVLEHPGKFRDEKVKKGLEESWEAIYGRQKDRRRVAILEEGMKLSQLSLTANDSQFLETRQFQRSEIAGWFHVPPHMIGDTEKSTSWGTGIEQQQIGFLVFTLRPDLVTWEQRLTRDLIPASDRGRFFVEFSIEGFLRGDSLAQAQFFRTMREIGVYSANDIRALMNLNPIEGGDIYLQPSNLEPLGDSDTRNDEGNVS